MAESEQDVPEQPGSLDFQSGRRALEGLLGDDPEFGDIEDHESEGAEDAPTGSEEDFEEAPEGEQPEEDFEEDDDESGEPDDEVEDEAEDEPSDPDDDPQTFTVKVDGEEMEVTLDEALSGYQRHEAFTRKTQELAEERKTIQEQADQLAAERAAYQQRLEVVEKALQQQMGEEPDWERLKQEDPARYAELRAAHQERKEQIEAVQAEIEQTQQLQQQQAAEERARVLQVEQEQLLSKIPEWVDSDVAEAEQVKLLEVGQTVYGFDQKELAQILDHRAILVLRDAMKYQELQSKGRKAKEETRSKKRKSSTLKPGTTKDKKSRKKGNTARKKLSKTGRIDDAATVLMDMIPEE